MGQGWREVEIIVQPQTSGRQELIIETGPQATVCTLTNRSDRVASGWAEPYLVVYITPNTRAEIDGLKAGTYDFSCETGFGWDRDSLAFRETCTSQRSLRPLRLFGGPVVITAYAVNGGNLPLADL
ncbi:hypothetical protein [Actinomadura sp. 9N407]|uniref:hypothetical protein n=1 Tax=Actinomadura sp. 9N407 TaxID=3375154 RepID=UPI0037B23F63